LTGQIQRTPAQQRGARQRSVAAPMPLCQRERRVGGDFTVRQRHQILNIFHHFIRRNVQIQVGRHRIGHGGAILGRIL
jgi:hypothetical protein